MKYLFKVTFFLIALVIAAGETKAFEVKPVVDISDITEQENVCEG